MAAQNRERTVSSARLWCQTHGRLCVCVLPDVWALLLRAGRAAFPTGAPARETGCRDASCLLHRQVPELPRQWPRGGHESLLGAGQPAACGPCGNWGGGASSWGPARSPHASCTAQPVLTLASVCNAWGLVLLSPRCQALTPQSSHTPPSSGGPSRGSRSACPCFR